MDHHFNVYPNPSNGLLSIDRPEGYNQYTLIDKLGRVLKNGDLEGQNTIHLAVPSDIYYMRLDNKNMSRSLISKIVILE